MITKEKRARNIVKAVRMGGVAGLAAVFSCVARSADFRVVVLVGVGTFSSAMATDLFLRPKMERITMGSCAKYPRTRG